MSWSKIHTQEWLYGSIRKHPPEIRAIWPDLQAMATDSILTGSVCISPTLGYHKSQLAEVFNCPLETLEKALQIFIDEQYILILDNGVIEILGWPVYQNEYQRLKKYVRGTKKYTEKCTKKSTNASVSVSVSKSDTSSVRKKECFVPPTKEEFSAYCTEKGFSNIADRAYLGYTENNWHDANDKPIRNWKSKLCNGWFSEKNKDKKPMTTAEYYGEFK